MTFNTADSKYFWLLKTFCCSIGLIRNLMCQVNVTRKIIIPHVGNIGSVLGVVAFKDWFILHVLNLKND